MKYLRAYLSAWWDIFSYASAFYLVVATIIYVCGRSIDILFMPYILWVTSVAALGGVVREGMK